MNLIDKLPNVGIQNVTEALQVSTSRTRSRHLSSEEMICVGFFLLEEYFSTHSIWSQVQDNWNISANARMKYVKMAEAHFEAEGVKDLRAALYKKSQNTPNVISINSTIDLMNKVEELLKFKNKVERVLNVNFI